MLCASQGHPQGAVWGEEGRGGVLGVGAARQGGDGGREIIFIGAHGRGDARRLCSGRQGGRVRRPDDGREPKGVIPA